MHDHDIDDAMNPRQAYLLHTMRCLWVRLEEMQSDLAAVGGALKLGIINNDMAAGLMSGAGVLHLLDVEEYASFETTFGVILPDALSTTTPEEHDDAGRNTEHDAERAARRPDGGLAGSPTEDSGGSPPGVHASPDRVRQDGPGERHCEGSAVPQ
jgi:hypothetical protein